MIHLDLRDSAVFNMKDPVGNHCYSGIMGNNNHCFTIIFMKVFEDFKYLNTGLGIQWSSNSVWVRLPPSAPVKSRLPEFILTRELNIKRSK